MDIAEYERIIPNAKVETPNGPVTFILPNQQCAWRVQTLFTKEPDTIEWIAGMKSGETLFDVGANMGQYSLLAAKAGLKVHAFEPEAQNFALLVRNIATNEMRPLCTPWPFALSDHMSIEVLHLSSMFPGGSCHAYGEPIDFRGEQRKFPYIQGSMSTTLDHFTSKYGYADHIKIDVDGFEHLVMKGGLVTFGKAKSVLIEINTKYPEHMEYILPKMAELGFVYDAELANSSRRKEGTFEGVGNIIFTRPS